MNCKNCIFATWNGEKNSQLGCSANRLSKFIDLEKAEVTTNKNISYYELKRLCNLYRTEEWKNKHESNNLLEQALLEVKPSFGIVVYDITKGDSLQKTLDSIYRIRYDKKRIKIVLSSFQTKSNAAYLVQSVHKTQEKGFRCVAFIHKYEEFNSSLRDRECFNKILPYSQFVRIRSGSILSENTFKEIDNSINNKLEQISLVRDGDVSIIPSSIVNQEYLNYNDYDLMVQGIAKTTKSHVQI